MIDLTELQEDILTLAIENPDRTNKEIAAILDCSPDWVGEVRRKYEHKVNEAEVTDDLKTASGTASNPPMPNSGESGSSYDVGIVAATAIWWLPILAWAQGSSPESAWILFTIGWVGVPAAVLLDAKERGSLGGGLIYTIASVVLPMFSGLVYLYRRR